MWSDIMARKENIYSNGLHGESSCHVCDPKKGSCKVGFSVYYQYVGVCHMTWTQPIVYSKLFLFWHWQNVTDAVSDLWHSIPKWVGQLVVGQVRARSLIYIYSMKLYDIVFCMVHWGNWWLLICIFCGQMSLY